MLTAPITTVRLLLRVPEPADLAALRELCADAGALEHVGTRAAWSDDLARRRLGHWIGHHAEHGYGPLTVTLRTDGSVAGFFGLQAAPDVDGPELSGMLLRRHWRRGYVSEAMAGYFPLVARDPRFPRVVARMETAHPARPAIERSLFLPYGFAFDGELSYHGTPMRYYHWTR